MAAFLSSQRTQLRIIIKREDIISVRKSIRPIPEIHHHAGDFNTHEYFISNDEHIKKQNHITDC